MIRNVSNLTHKYFSKNYYDNFSYLISTKKSNYSHYRWMSISRDKNEPEAKSTSSSSSDNDHQSTELVEIKVGEIFEKEFPEYYKNGKIMERISYVDFIDQALERLKDLGLERNLNAYKELLKVFPPGRYTPKSSWDIGMFHAPQQLCAVRVLFMMEINSVKPDKEVERIVVNAFSIHSDVWKKVARANYWSMKGRNIDNYPIPSHIPEETHEIAKIAITRMLDDQDSIIFVKNTSSLPDVVDKTWIVYSQSPLQQSIIEKLDTSTILYVEQFGTSYITDKSLSYFVLKMYDNEEKLTKRRNLTPKIHYNYNSLNMRFYGKPIEDKLFELENVHQVDDGQILGVAITGTSSHDSALSWLKLMQQRNPNLNHLNVVFRLERPIHELVNVHNPDPSSEYKNP